MTMQRPLEGLLRPPLEWYSSLVSVMAAVLLVASSNQLLLPMSLAYAGAILLIVLALIRGKQGFRIWRYQRNLKRMPTYTMTSKQLPVSQQHLFLGQGFLWLPVHTQRLRDLDLAYNQKYRYPSKLYQLARQLEFEWENKWILSYLTKWFKKDSLLNPVQPYPDIGGEPCLHGVSETEEPITLSLTERAGHMLVIGTTGVGKTRLAEMLIAQDIRRGDVVIVLDPKGDAELLRRIYIEASLANREHDLLILHLAFPEHSCRYNPIGNFTKVTQVATRITNALPSTGEAASFKEFAWKYTNLVARVLIALGIRPTYKLINYYITKLEQLLIRYCEELISEKDINYINFIDNYIKSNSKKNKQGEISEPTRKQAIFAYAEESIVNNVKDDVLIDLYTACRLDKTYYDKITASVGPLLEKVTSGAIADLLSPNYEDLNDDRPILDWLQAIRNNQIVYVGMDALTDTVISSTVGNAMLSDLVAVAGHIYNFGLDYGFEDLIDTKTVVPRICLHSDEFNEVIGDEFIPILNKARGAGFNVTAYSQTWSDVEARLLSNAKAGQVAGNLNAVIMFRTKEAKTVDMLLNQLPVVPIVRITPASSSADSPQANQGVFYQSSNEDRLAYTEVSLIQQNDVLNLPKGQAFCLLQGGKLYKIRIPLPVSDEQEIATDIMDLLNKMNKKSIGGKFNEI